MPTPTRHLITLVLATTLLAGCGPDKVEQAASDVCECMEPIYTMLEQAMEAAGSGDRVALGELGDTMKEYEAKGKACMAGLKEKYGDMKDDPQFRSAVEQRIREKCPPPKLFGGK
jgi:outer membrane murein-binding lipoprotein Lpp